MIIRSCPICQGTKYKSHFKFTYDYLLNVQKADIDLLKYIGFEKDSISSIVSCEDCEFLFIRENYQYDMKFESFWETKPRVVDNMKMGKPIKFKDRRLKNLLCNSIIARLLMYVNPSINNPLDMQKWLDFGCGNGLLALMANGISFVDILGYDINAAKLSVHNKKGLKITDSLDEVSSKGP